MLPWQTQTHSQCSGLSNPKIPFIFDVSPRSKNSTHLSQHGREKHVLKEPDARKQGHDPERVCVSFSKSKHALMSVYTSFNYTQQGLAWSLTISGASDSFKGKCPNSPGRKTGRHQHEVTTPVPRENSPDARQNQSAKQACDSFKTFS